MVKETENWFAAAPISQRELLCQLRSLVLATTLDAVEEIKWNRPCYSSEGLLYCYIGRARGHVTLGFQRGSELADPYGLLEGNGKDMRHVKITCPSSLNEEAVRALLLEAISSRHLR